MKTPWKHLLALSALSFLAACGGGDDSVDDRIDVADPKVRLVHAVPLGPAVSLFRNDAAQASDVTGLPYLGASNYFDVDSGSARWDVRTTSGGATIGSQTFDATRGDKFTLVAVPDASSGTEVLLISDPYNKSVTSDNARVRVLNAAFNAPDVDVYLTAPNADLTNLAPHFPSIDYKSAHPATNNDSNEFEGNTYQLRITAAGSKTPVFSATLTLAENADVLLTLVPDSVAPNDVKVLRVESDTSTPAVEVANAL